MVLGALPQFRRSYVVSDRSGQTFPIDNAARQQVLSQISHAIGSEPLSPQVQNVLGNIGQESHAPIFYRDLYGIARHLEDQATAAVSVSIYQYLVSRSDLPSGLQRRAAERLALFQGEGSWGQRLEWHARGFLHQVTAPEMIVGMTAGGLSFRLGRCLGLGLARGASLGRGSAWGLGLTTAWLGESSAFVMAAKGTGSLLGRPENWSSSQLWQEWSSAALMFGSLRAAGSATQYLTRTTGLVATMPRTAWSFQHIGMYSGIVGSHWLEQNIFGRHSSQSRGSLLLDSLAEFFTFQAGGYLARRLLGRHFVPLERRMEQSSQQLYDYWSQQAKSRLWPAETMFGLQVAMAGESVLSGKESTLSLMIGDGRGSAKGPWKPGETIHPNEIDPQSEGTGSFMIEATGPGESGSQPRSPFKITHHLQVSRRMLRENFQFAERLKLNDVHFDWLTEQPIENHLDSITAILNVISLRIRLRESRRVVFRFPLIPEQANVVLKSDAETGHFFQTFETPTIATPVSGVQIKANDRPTAPVLARIRVGGYAATAENHFLRAHQILTGEYPRVRDSQAPEGRRVVVPITRLGTLSREIGKIISAGPSVVPRAGAAGEANPPVRRLIFSRETPITSAELGQLQSLLSYLPSGMVLKIQDATGRRVYRFELIDYKVEMTQEALE